MRIVVVGTGVLGSAVAKLLVEHGHETVPVSRSSGKFRADITDHGSLQKLFATIGQFDAVASAAGGVFPGPFNQLTDEQWAKSIASKGMGQINLVRSALPHINDRGSFTLISSVLTDHFVQGGTIGTTIDHFVEGFVKAAATELPRGIRINCVSPTVLVESPQFQSHMPGFPPIPAAEVALAYLRAIANPITGRILKLHNMNC
jgi:NAD(P)-dependent dehydrogenase (short-subunit alcohol dehydrogenase family)